MTNQFYDIKEFSTSHSSRALFESCPRKLEMRKFYGSDARETSHAADVGTCLHTGYQNWLQTHDEEQAVVAMMLDYPVESYFDETKNRDRSIEACYITLMNMISVDKMKNYQLATVKGLDGLEHPAIEVPFEIEVQNFKLGGEVPITYRGWIDAILYDPFRDMYMVVDVKTHRQHADDLSAKYQFDEQCLPYGLVLENILGHKVDTFEVYYFSCFIDLLKPRANFYDFQKTYAEVYDWAQGFYYHLRQVDQFYRTGWFPRSTTGDTCFAYGKPCRFLSECAYRDHSILKQLIVAEKASHTPTDNRRGEWNPWIRIALNFGDAVE